MATADTGHSGEHLDPGVGARGFMGGPTTEVGCSLSPSGPFSLATVKPCVQVLFEAILWRGGGAGVGPVLTWI